MEAACSPTTAGKFVVVGGGIAGVTCAEQVRGARRRLRLSSIPEAVALEAPSPPAFRSFFPGRSLAASFYPFYSFLLPDIRDFVVAPDDVLSTSQAFLPPQGGAMASKLLGETQSGLNPALVLVMSKPMGRRGAVTTSKFLVRKFDPLS